jgi:hypothetical protein
MEQLSFWIMIYFKYYNICDNEIVSQSNDETWSLVATEERNA